ncbi:hypothetical protein M3P21_11890 [Ruegeria sp. 2012CJ41-6]|uniref:Molybdopterin dinucleotide-binding domain-containing protein n=1 Tax=Ruegeria spongiae TaxID=2942209 RepID=A0ABT0Q2X4_9RHOB|nr:molybdopterin dinucleotide binding domain-containing protein [Ruegeria spongiae]MCL6284228.1 hypothetical protein [Ruegeria spongiae]
MKHHDRNLLASAHWRTYRLEAQHGRVVGLRAFEEGPGPAPFGHYIADVLGDLASNPLDTPPGKIEIYSETIAFFDYEECPDHPAWMEPVEWLGRAGPVQLHMIFNQPHNKLHSQLDHGPVSRADRPNGSEPVTMHPEDAAARNQCDGQNVRLHNARGACLAERLYYS